VRIPIQRIKLDVRARERPREAAGENRLAAAARADDDDAFDAAAIP
jgi:hypothetical protein